MESIKTILERVMESLSDENKKMTNPNYVDPGGIKEDDYKNHMKGSDD